MSSKSATRETSEPLRTENSAQADSISASDRIVQAIINGIREGDFAPGQRLLEPDLSRRWNVSRSSVREALKQLEAAGMITLTRFRGAYISQLNRQAILNLLDVLESLVGLAARTAAQKCTSAASQQLILQSAHSIAKAARSENKALYVEGRRKFYTSLIEVSGNDEIARAIPLSRTHLFRARLEGNETPADWLRRAADYARIAEAIAAQKPAEAEAAVRRHYAWARKMVRQLPAETFGESR